MMKQLIEEKRKFEKLIGRKASWTCFLEAMEANSHILATRIQQEEYEKAMSFEAWCRRSKEKSYVG